LAEIMLLAISDPVRRRFQEIQALIRSNEFLLIPVAAMVGVCSGLAVAVMSWTAQLAHVLIFGIPLDVRLSAHAAVDPIVALIAPAAGGLLLGCMEWYRQRRGIYSATDPVEANALRGGNMSMRDSIVVSVQTLISNGCGASVGLEAGYTQIGAGTASLFGRWLNLRRNDLRLLVGCGAAGAIGAAFNAPLTGAFYACELIVGVYSVASAAPVLAASISAAFVAVNLSGAPYSLDVPTIASGSFTQAMALAFLAVLISLVGIGTMRMSAFAERLMNQRWLPVWIRPLLGGLCVGALAIYTPQILAAGHGAMVLDLEKVMPLGLIALIVVLKLFACTVSLASGFRGGLFFASLFVGSLLGKLYGGLFVMFGAGWGIGLDETATALTGMAALGVAIVGGPLTMAFLVLEMTHNFQVTATALAACLVTSVFVRGVFGHSFSTWRLYLRGVTVRGAEDVGWVRGLTVSSMMRTDVATVRSETSVAECRRRFQLGSHKALFVVNANGAYRGIVLLPDVFSDESEDGGSKDIISLAKYPETTLAGSMNVTSAMKLFDDAGADVLAVLEEGGVSVVGFLSEAYARRRYIEELNLATGGFAQEAP
jgi:CIC family chloride channel protein